MSPLIFSTKTLWHSENVSEVRDRCNVKLIISKG